MIFNNKVSNYNTVRFTSSHNSSKNLIAKNTFNQIAKTKSKSVFVWGALIPHHPLYGTDGWM